MSPQIIASVAALLFQDPGQQAAPPQSADEPTSVAEVVIPGVRPDPEAVETFVDSVGAPPFGATGLATWDIPLCVEIDNLQPATAERIRDRIAGRAEMIGLDVASPGCAANVLVVATADGALTASELVDASPRSFRIASAETQLDRRALGRFRDSTDAVRWWTVSLPVDALTRQVLANRQNNFVWRDTGARPSQVRYVMNSVVVVIDASKTGDVHIDALGDYIAFVVLAQTDAEARGREQPTILNLFDDPPHVSEWSSWDLAYIEALYDRPVGRGTFRRHRQDIARSILENMTGN